MRKRRGSKKKRRKKRRCNREENRRMGKREMRENYGFFFLLIKLINHKFLINLFNPI